MARSLEEAGEQLLTFYAFAKAVFIRPLSEFAKQENTVSDPWLEMLRIALGQGTPLTYSPP